MHPIYTVGCRILIVKDVIIHHEKYQLFDLLKFSHIKSGIFYHSEAKSDGVYSSGSSSGVILPDLGKILAVWVR